MSICIQQAGLLASIQDTGRPLQQEYGIGSAGALDTLAHQLAQILVGNPGNAAGIELFAGPFSFTAEQACWIGLSGAQIDGEIIQAGQTQPIHSGWRYPLAAGASLRIRGLRQGRCCYLSFRGGLDLPLLRGSRSTDLAAGFGGWHGQALQTGSRITLLQSDAAPLLHSTGVRQLENDGVVRILTGPEWSELSLQSQLSLVRQGWQVSPQSNRMALRLRPGAATPPLTLQRKLEMLSHAVFPGVIQLPPNGAPIVLLADAQSTGGYPRLATVIRADLWKLAQLCPGQSVYFQRCELAEAASAWQAQQSWLEQIQRNLARYTQ